MTRFKTILNVDANDHDELLEQVLHKMEQSQLLKTESERLNNDLIKQKTEQTNLHHELQQLEQQFDDLKDELNKTKQELLTNKTKYETQLDQLNQSIEQIHKEKHSIEIQFKELQTQFINQTNQYDYLQTKFHESSIENNEQISKYEKDSAQQQTLIDNLHRESNDLQDELKSKTNEILSLQTNLNKLQQILQTKIDEIEQLSQQKLTLTEDNNQKEKFLFEQKQLTEAHSALEEKFNNVLTDKAALENQLDTIRVKMQTTESNINKRKEDNLVKLEQAEKRIKELQVSFINIGRLNPKVYLKKFILDLSPLTVQAEPKILHDFTARLKKSLEFRTGMKIMQAIQRHFVSKLKDIHL
jgi:chromosome segregation ATPase